MKTTRKLLSTAGGLAALLAAGCFPILPTEIPQENGTITENSHSITGVEGFNTPEEILANENVAQAIDQLRQRGYDLSPSINVNPPNIEETYLAERQNIFPNENPTSLDLLRFNQQTSDNYLEIIHLENDFRGGIRHDISTKGKPIIRGQDDKFTIYSFTEFRPNTECDADFITILDGRKENQGHLSGIYLEIPIKHSSQCEFFVSANEVYLQSVRY